MSLYRDLPERLQRGMLSLLSLFLTFILCNCLLFNIRLFSKLVGGGDIKAPFLEINIPRIVSSVLPPTWVNQASVPESNSTCFHISFVCQTWSRCSEGIVIFQSGTAKQYNSLVIDFPAGHIRSQLGHKYYII